MQQSLVIERISKILLVILPFVTVVITPSINFDAVNVPKFAVLTFGIFLSIGIVLGNNLFALISMREVRWLSATLLLIILWNLVTNGIGSRQLFGSFGSNLGFVTFFSLIVLFAVMSMQFSLSFYPKFLFAIMVSGAVNSFYGILQYIDRDPINWVRPYGALVGTLGNPNYLSSLLGISGVACLTLIMRKVSTLYRVFLIVLLLIMFSLIVLSNSIQGIFAILVGVSILVYSRYVVLLTKSFQILTFVALLIFVFLVTAGITNRGPLSASIYGNSVIARQFYWGAALEMSKERPWGGFGFDTFGTIYRYYRSESAAKYFGSDNVANSAHNAFLDFLVIGGLPLLVSIVVLSLVVARIAWKAIVQTKSFNAVHSGLVACWAATLIQMLVSPIQIGVFVWFWATSGAVLGYRRDSQSIEAKTKAPRRNVLPPKTILLGFISLALSILVVIQPLSRDIHFQRAVESRDANQIAEAALRWPQDPYYLNYASELFLASNLNVESLRLAKRSVLIFPDNFTGWRLISMNPNASASEKVESVARMKALDPNLE